LGIITAVLVVLLVGGAVIAYILLEPRPVNVTGVRYQFTGTDAPNCGWSNLTGAGATGLSNGKIKVSISLTTPSSSGPCQIAGVDSVTGGFSVENFTAPAKMGGGVGGILTVTLGNPPGGYSGVLTLQVIVKLPGGTSP